MTHDPSVRSDPLVTRSVVPGGSVRAGAHDRGSASSLSAETERLAVTKPSPVGAARTTPYTALGVLLEGSIRGLVREYDVAPHAPCRQCGCAGR